MSPVKEKKIALVCGATQGIGLAIAKQLVQLSDYKKIYATYRDTSDLNELEQLQEQNQGLLELIKFNIENDQDAIAIKNTIESSYGVLDFCINSIGTLTDEIAKPERRITEIKKESLDWSFQVNTWPTVLLAREMKSLLVKSAKPTFVAISAKVGSIADNRLGGWYSYRMSKAALNMAVVTFSKEMYFANKSSLVLAIHPGTTDTNLSAPFQVTAKKKYILHSAESTAQNILNVIQSCQPGENNGDFLSWDGQPIAW